MAFNRALLAALLLGLVLSGLITASEPGSSNTNELGPAPIDADGLFTNWAGELTHGSFGVRFSFLLRRAGGLFGGRPDAPTRIENDGEFVRANVAVGLPTVTWIGHSTLLVQMDRVTFLTDPIWSERPSPIRFLGPQRFVPPGMALEDLPQIDFVLISHNHYDHLDLPTLVSLSERDPKTRFLVPLGNGALLREEGIALVEELDWGEGASHAGLRIECLPAQHWSKRGLSDDRRALWSSWAVSGPKRNFYFSGDTGYFEGFARIGEALGPFDLAAVAIGAYEPTEMMRQSHMNPEEAVQAAVDLEARRALAIHFGTFNLSDEPLDEPPRRFLEAALDAMLGSEDAWVLQIGETRIF